MSKPENISIKQLSLFILSVVLIILGILFLVTAAEVAPVFRFFYGIENILGRYIIVILTMASGIMTFSTVAATLEKEDMRNKYTLGITIFSTVLTVPLVYVFIAIFYAERGIVDPIGEFMMIVNISEGFRAWFGEGVFLYIIYSFMLLLSLIFITVPLLTGYLTIKGKALKIGKLDSGKFGIGTIELPVISKVKISLREKS